MMAEWVSTTTAARACNVAMTIERDGLRIRAESDGPAHIVVPVQFSHCLVVSNGAPIRLTRVNLCKLCYPSMVRSMLALNFGSAYSPIIHVDSGMAWTIERLALMLAIQPGLAPC